MTTKIPHGEMEIQGPQHLARLRIDYTWATSDLLLIIYFPLMAFQSNAYRHPRQNLFGTILMRLVNSRTLAKIRYALMSRLGFLKMESDVTDVIYLTWLVDAHSARKLVPPGMRLWEREGKTPFTILTYKHGHFGPALMGRLRNMFPSPMQSNWRLYLEDDQRGASTARSVYFLKNIMDSVLYVFSTRMFSDIMQTHLAEKFTYERSQRAFALDIRAGDGSSPSLSCQAAAQKDKDPDLTPPFRRAFGSWSDAVEYLSLQDVAVSYTDRLKGMVAADIDLPIDLGQVQPFDVPADGIACSFLEQFSTTEGPFCFVVPRVKFRVVSERMI